MNYIQRTLLPGTCVICQQASYSNQDLCLNCESDLHLIERPCLQCALPLPTNYIGHFCGTCLTHAPPFHFTVCAFDYRPPLKKVISDFKYQGKLCNGRVMAYLLSKRLKQFYQNQVLPQAIIPVPLHRKRLRERGFNQAGELSRYLSKSLNIPIQNRLCQRTKYTHAQMGLTAKQRQQNLQKAFSLKPAENITSLNRVAIVDDVITTMSTVSELSKILLQNGVNEIHIWSIARACK